MEVLTTPRCSKHYMEDYKHEFMSQVLTLQTRVYNTDGSINITNTSI